MFEVHCLRTYSVFDFVILLRAKPRPSKKARLDKTTEEDVVLEAGKTPNAEAAIPEDIPNDPPQQDDDLIAEERPTDISGPIHQPTGSLRIESSTGPAKPTDKPTAPVQTGGPRMMKLSLLALAILSQTILSLYPNILPRKNLLPLAKASGTLI